MMCSSSAGLMAPEPLSASRCPQASGANRPRSCDPITLKGIAIGSCSSMILLFPPVLQKRRGELGGPLNYVIDWVLFRVDDRVRRLVELFPGGEQPLQLPFRLA